MVDKKETGWIEMRKILIISCIVIVALSSAVLVNQWINVLLNENPLWWIISAVSGLDIKMVFTVSLIIRMLICSILYFG